MKYGVIVVFTFLLSILYVVYYILFFLWHFKLTKTTLGYFVRKGYEFVDIEIYDRE